MSKLQLFANCVPVKGANRSIICDLQRNQFELIPNALYYILDHFIGQTLEDIKSHFEQEEHHHIEEYLGFLEQQEYIFWKESALNFPAINRTWEFPGHISNAIVDFDDYSRYPVEALFQELSDLGCKYLQIRCFGTPRSLAWLSKIVQQLKQSRISSCEILMPYNDTLSQEELKGFVKDFPRVSGIISYGAPENRYFTNRENLVGNLIFLLEHIYPKISCGVISHHYFHVNLESLTESTQFNSCLNKKISIDSKGDIRNCPSMPRSYGNIKDTTLGAALHHPDFKRYWNIHKDKIHVCKDCEFRYICTDCRAYVENPEDIHSKPLKCGYNPYTNEWSAWNTNPLKQKAMEYYGMENPS
ncbi:MAG: grasp-with-spasm system SPASM domain peptide maturase [Bacteroidota bacterium]